MAGLNQLWMEIQSSNLSAKSPADRVPVGAKDLEGTGAAAKG
jgi:hypothetical protein